MGFVGNLSLCSSKRILQIDQELTVVTMVRVSHSLFSTHGVYC